MKKKNLKEQALSAAKPKGLPAPADLANKINASGMSGDETLAWLGAVLSRVSMGAGSSTPPEEEPVASPEPPLPSPEAVQERLENKLLDSLLSDVAQSTRRKRNV
tara:strand:+ start:648 stop:962 length:315 start_codon:yes stop_codon:yes gene_type:complete